MRKEHLLHYFGTKNIHCKRDLHNLKAKGNLFSNTEKYPLAISISKF